eukprot:3197290-Pyramimonas_sp.AAC.1
MDECANELRISMPRYSWTCRSSTARSVSSSPMQASRSLGYPATVALMEVSKYASPRMPKTGRNVSMAFQAGKSVGAGPPR